jgi:hypothetical protein
MRHRRVTAAVFALITLFFAIGIKNVQQVRAITGGHVTSVNDVGIYDRYLTNVALMRLGDA